MDFKLFHTTCSMADSTLCGESPETIAVGGEPLMTPHSFFLGDCLRWLPIVVGEHGGEPLEIIAVGSNLRQSPRKKLLGVTSGSPPTAIVSGDSPQRLLSAMERVVWKSSLSQTSRAYGYHACTVAL